MTGKRHSRKNGKHIIALDPGPGGTSSKTKGGERHCRATLAVCLNTVPRTCTLRPTIVYVRVALGSAFLPGNTMVTDKLPTYGVTLRSGTAYILQIEPNSTMVAAVAGLAATETQPRVPKMVPHQ